jgi:hypothetical protein
MEWDGISFCFLGCKTHADCLSGTGICEALETFTCLPTKQCKGNSQCTTNEYCTVYFDYEDQLTPVCLDKGTGDPIGASCQTTNNCASGICLTDAAGNYCTGFCASATVTQDCGTGYLCINATLTADTKTYDTTVCAKN